MKNFENFSGNFIEISSVIVLHFIVFIFVSPRTLSAIRLEIPLAISLKITSAVATVILSKYVQQLHWELLIITQISWENPPVTSFKFSLKISLADF